MISLASSKLSCTASDAENQTSPNRCQFTVIIPTFNRATLVTRAIESALVQTVSPSQIIVVDDGSTDDTAEVCKTLASKIKYIYQPNGGASAARNRGIRLACSPWIAFLDSDDYWSANHLEKIADTIEATSGRGRFYFSNLKLPEGGRHDTLWERIGLNFTGPHLFIQDGTPWMLMPWQPCLLQCTVFNASLLKRSGGFDPLFPVWEDTELFCRLGIGGEICLVNNVGCVQTADDGSGNRLTERIHSRGARYWQLHCLLINDLVARFPELKPSHRQALRNELANDYWRLSRLAWRSGHFLSSGSFFVKAFAVQPAFLKKRSFVPRRPICRCNNCLPTN